MIYYMRKRLLDILIKLLERELSDMPKEPLSKEQSDGLLSQMWENPSFRKYVADRDAKLIFTMAGSEGMEPEPRDKYVMHTGQRFEILLLAAEAKKAFNRRTERLSVEATTRANES
jgi:hypothetical protein